LEASSGNTAIALSYLSNLFDLKVIVVLPKNTNSCKKRLIQSYGAELIEID
jgi:S-sulfo-L-cysteine synthase (O-acetyl-L-serine-dependent)